MTPSTPGSVYAIAFAALGLDSFYSPAELIYEGKSQSRIAAFAALTPGSSVNKAPSGYDARISAPRNPSIGDRKSLSPLLLLDIPIARVVSLLVVISGDGESVWSPEKYSNSDVPARHSKRLKRFKEEVERHESV
jgi:hypothetical protein